MNILFVYRDQELGEALEIEFLEVENVTILHGDITTVACDAIVSPANSFGFMDGYGGPHCLDTNGAFLRFEKDCFRLPELNPLFQNTPYQESILPERRVV